ncbi:gamma-glutamyltransferase family protein [Methylobacterium sp. J-088]|uniref:gamma-glutamyltransferase family protein n=1 Tax=Methylobacterium sp. J-088 TaxID=2836664 RepID=UPI001FBA7335|nr:gamma-glutamyltransferase family protein [Methylobacterium sp. J-088]MCJ2062199.1 gamma-glutamyltransferase family protein [Methylobacterium sp. J-088]
MTGLQSPRAFRAMPTDTVTFHPRIFGQHGAVAAEHYLAPMAGIEIMKAGGTAVDAAVAACLVEGVVNPQMHTIGGEIPILIAAPGEAGVVCVNGNTVAPATATPEAFLRRGYDKVPPDGPLAAGVPGAPGALLEALRRYGRLSFADVSAPARDLARGGFPVHSGLLRQHKFGILDNAERFQREWQGSAAVYLPGGQPPQEGAIICNPALAGMLDFMANEERRTGGSRETGLHAAFEAFYKGDIAAEITAFVARHDGFLTREDLARFEVPVERPLSVRYAGIDLYKCGPWTQGPAVLQTLSILKNFDLAALGHNSAAYVHLVVEAMKLAFADREQFYGDPLQVSVPTETLISDAYGSLRAALVGEYADRSLRPGDAWAGTALLPPEERLGGLSWGPGTVHVDAMDQAGYTAAFTPSGAWIKSAEVVPALGFPLGVRLSNFQLQPAHHPNVIAPFKRPRTTISPSLALKDGKPWLAFGSMGGDQQDQWQLQFFLNRVVFGMPLQAAIEAPKFSSEHFPALFHPHDFYLNRLRIETSVGRDTLDGLAARGHEIDPAPPWTEGYLCGTERHLETGVLEAGSDPRGNKSEVFPAFALAY